MKLQPESVKYIEAVQRALWLMLELTIENDLDPEIEAALLAIYGALSTIHNQFLLDTIAKD